MPLLDESTSPHSRSIAFKRLRLGAIVLGVLVILAFAGASAYDTGGRIVMRWSQRIASSQRRQGARRANRVDLAGDRSTAARYGALVSKRRPADRAGATERSSGQPHGGGAASTLAHDRRRAGHPAHRSRGPRHRISTSRTARTSLLSGPMRDGTLMSEPLVTRSENRPGFVLSRRLEDDQGRFVGVITAIIDLEDLSNSTETSTSAAAAQSTSCVRTGSSGTQPRRSEASGEVPRPRSRTETRGNRRVSRSTASGVHRCCSGEGYAPTAHDHSRRGRRVAAVARRGRAPSIASA